MKMSSRVESNEIPKWLLEQYPQLSRLDVLCTGSRLQVADIFPKLQENLEDKVHTKEHKLARDWELLLEMWNTTMNRKAD